MPLLYRKRHTSSDIAGLYIIFRTVSRLSVYEPFTHCFVPYACIQCEYVCISRFAIRLYSDSPPAVFTAISAILLSAIPLSAHIITTADLEISALSFFCIYAIFIQCFIYIYKLHFQYLSSLLFLNISIKNYLCQTLTLCLIGCYNS